QEGLGRGACERDRADRGEFAKRYFQAKREQQQGDADFRELLDLVGVDHGQAAGERPYQDPSKDVADDQRLLESLRDKGTDKRRDQHEREIAYEFHRWKVRPVSDDGSRNMPRLAHQPALAGRGRFSSEAAPHRAVPNRRASARDGPRRPRPPPPGSRAALPGRKSTL